MVGQKSFKNAHTHTHTCTNTYMSDLQIKRRQIRRHSAHGWPVILQKRVLPASTARHFEQVDFAHVFDALSQWYVLTYGHEALSLHGVLHMHIFEFITFEFVCTWWYVLTYGHEALCCMASCRCIFLSLYVCVCATNRHVQKDLTLFINMYVCMHM
jgi:hypothetical protein